MSAYCETKLIRFSQVKIPAWSQFQNVFRLQQDAKSRKEPGSKNKNDHKLWGKN